MGLFPSKKRSISPGAFIEPDEIFLDAHNLPSFDRDRFQGRIEKPISKNTLFLIFGIFILVGLVFTAKIYVLQVAKGAAYADLSETNRLRYSLLFADRGVIYDRNQKVLASNSGRDSGNAYALRTYTDLSGLAHIVGYVKYPAKDNAGFYWDDELSGKDGVEKVYNDILGGRPGVDIIEVDALGRLTSHSVSVPPQNGKDLTLSVDASVTNALYGYIRELTKSAGFEGGAGMIMDVTNGEVLAMTSFPEYDPNLITAGIDREAIQTSLNDPKKPFLDRMTQGLYTPGSIVKPFIAIGALNEGIISPSKEILSTGSISIPNPFDSTKPSVFRDWRAHGLVDMRLALAYSSDVYFYAIGGGFEDQKGLGITALEKYLRLFGLGSTSINPFFAGPEGTIPNPAWKAEHFEDSQWRIGDTYNTSIGQYGFQITPMQAVRATAAIANDGKIMEPTIIKGDNSPVANARTLSVSDYNFFKIVKEGMRAGVTESRGTATGLNIGAVEVAAKTGTAELGVSKAFVNSWVVGFFPYDNPRYAFVVMMERGPRANTVGATYVMRQLLLWMSEHTPEYLTVL